MGEKRGSIAFFSTYRPPIPLNLFARPFNGNPKANDYLLIDKKSYNYNGREIPKSVLKTLLKHTTKVREYFKEEDVEKGHVSGLVFVSERYNNLETLHFAFRIVRDGCPESEVKVISFAQLYDNKIDVCKGDRMEDSGCFGGDRYFIFVSTHQRNEKRRQPWTAVYRTDLFNGHTIRLTPQGVADFSPSVSLSGDKIAVATLQGKDGGWSGEIENLDTNIAVIDIEYPHNRKIVLRNAGWPSWGSHNVLFFHRSLDKADDTVKIYKWAVYRAIFGKDFNSVREDMITPPDSNAMTPAAINSNLVAVSIISDTSPPSDKDNRGTRADKSRHIQLYDCYDLKNIKEIPVTRNTSMDLADHFNPFIIRNLDYSRETKIGYSRLDGVSPQVPDHYEEIEGDNPDEVGVVRVPGVFPTFTKKGDRLAFVDNDFQNVYLVDITTCSVTKILCVETLKHKDPNLGKDVGVFSPVWNQKDDKDILYVCVGPAFHPKHRVDIYAIFNASDHNTRRSKLLTNDGSNNAFPFTNPQGTKLVFRSTRDWMKKDYDPEQKWPKNLYIMHDLDNGDKGEVTRLTEGEWVDTHCQWSPNNDWIVFSSTRDKPDKVLDNGLDLGYFAIYLIKASDKLMSPVRVIRSGDLGAGHVNHPIFSPDGLGLVFTSDLAGVSVEPISLPLFIHSVRPYGDIFRVDLRNTEDIYGNQDIKEFTRVTHSRYENSTPNWACIKTWDLTGENWKELMIQLKEFTWKSINVSDKGCPISSRKTKAALAGQLGIEKRYC